MKHTINKNHDLMHPHNSYLIMCHLNPKKNVFNYLKSFNTLERINLIK